MSLLRQRLLDEGAHNHPNLVQLKHTYYLAWDDPKLPDDDGNIPKPNGVVGGSNPGHEIVSMPDM
jgi:hypothetical protein